jgi:4-amino-4-deoxychorismate lyase
MTVSESDLAGAACSPFQIISSLRFEPNLVPPSEDSYPEPRDSPYYLLRYHRDRLLNAAIHFKWPAAIGFLQRDLAQFTHTLDTFIPDRTKPWRLRVVVDNTGSCNVDVHAATPCPLQSLFIPSPSEAPTSLRPNSPWRLYVDTERTTPTAFTTHKTTARDHYTAARERVGIQSPQDPLEVLLINTDGEIMEGSITTPYFRRRHQDDSKAVSNEEDTNNAQWVTPPLSSGGNAGATRRYALEYGFCVQQVILAEDLVDGEECWLSNGVRGFIPAVIVLKR